MLPEGTSALPGRVRLWPYQGSIAVAIGSLAKTVRGDGGAWVLAAHPGPEGSADRFHIASSAPEK